MHLTVSSRYGAALAGVGAGVVLLMAGCGGTGTQASSPAPPPTTTSPTPVPSPSPSPSSSPSATPSSSPAPKVTKAADGRKLSACRDLRCEVEVKGGDTIRFAAKYDLQAFHVQQIAKQTLYFATADSEGSGMSGYVGGSGSVSTADAHIEITPLGSKRMILKIRPR
ncbi:hypothetical protein [Nonomuraea rubra]|uniref:hypothetical protein n=1 Tax=Nonomuraea rubra TaxID=46180 RepID=UPI0033E3EA2D